MTETMEVHLNQPVELTFAKKEGTGNLSFMGGSFYVTGLNGQHKEGAYIGAVLGCNGLYNGQPSPRRVIDLKKEAARGK